MKKKLLILTLCIVSQCFLQTLCFSQETPPVFSINQGLYPGSYMLKSKIQREFYFNNEQSILKVSIIKGKTIKIDVLDVKKMTTTISKKHKNPFKFDFIESVIKTDNKFYLIYSLKDKKSETEQFFARGFDPVRGDILDKDILLFTYNGKIQGRKVAPKGSYTVSMFNR